MFRRIFASRETRHHHRMTRVLSRELSPHMMRDIGLEPWPESPRIPPFAALITRD